jgi:hypothetical protein
MALPRLTPGAASAGSILPPRAGSADQDWDRQCAQARLPGTLACTSGAGYVYRSRNHQCNLIPSARRARMCKN